ncbi:MAG: UvrD-helicase domain-containing protein [Candidatus Didemnitutus sp.]|nr:UvrD-helicase domain-containing protein [Candidatus Didemnitutus sp.]
MTTPKLKDQVARERFRGELAQNFAVSANAGSGKTTAISQRLAELALSPHGAEWLPRTAVVTFTKKAAAQIGQRARAVLLQRLGANAGSGLVPLDHLERAFFGTIHSFCLLLAQRHGQALGLNLNPAVVASDDTQLWEEFLEADTMEFSALSPAQIDAFLRHVPLDAIFELAREIDSDGARRMVRQRPGELPPAPTQAALNAILAATARSNSLVKLRQNQATAEKWLQRFRDERGFLPLAKPAGTAGGIGPLFADFFAPLKNWLAQAGAVLAAELALRYREWRFERGVQTYADQIDAALAVLRDPAALARIRSDGWRIILDEAQDTDPAQFAVLVEITRSVGAALGDWPERGGAGPRAGHFCMVGDGQQSIYGARADIRNFQRHLQAFADGNGGELLQFDVTFRTPQRVIAALNRTLPAAFGEERAHNLGLPPAEGAPAPCLQVAYGKLEAGPKNAVGAGVVLPLLSAGEKLGVDAQLAAEVRQIATWLQRVGCPGVGAREWGEVCFIAPRNQWLLTARKELEAAGLKTSLQMRRNRNGDNPAFAWVTGLLAAICDPRDGFEWFGVLREVFGISDALLAAEWKAKGAPWQWMTPENYAPPVAGALGVLGKLVGGADDEGRPLESFAHELVVTCRLAEKARAIDPSGALNAELDRLQAQAATLGLEGAGPREWLAELRAELDEGRPLGKPSADAINLLTAHSSKGLEWPVVIPLGLWREVSAPPERGLRLVADGSGGTRVYFDSASLPDETKDSHERERLREVTRLLYVTLTRAKQTLVVPWGADFAKVGKSSFLDLWGADLSTWPKVGETEIPLAAADASSEAELPAWRVASGATVSAVPMPRRILPHQLSHRPDAVRAARHESEADDPVAKRNPVDPLDYGKWWHETVEFLPWSSCDEAVEEYLAAALAAAAEGAFQERATGELALLRAAGVWAELRSGRWQTLAEVSIVAPMGTEGWVDGVIDLVAHDEAGSRLLVLDWKTNLAGDKESVDALLARLREEYAPQLEAYRGCLAPFFAGAPIEVAIYATNVGDWVRW